MKPSFHRPVMLKESREYLLTRLDGIYVDCTLGGGGHSHYFLQEIESTGFLIGLDADPEAISQAQSELSSYGNTYFRQTFFDQLEIVLYELGRLPVTGVFFDLGVSSHQLDDTSRGFTFRGNAKLDMRMNPSSPQSAADILNVYSQEELGRVIRHYGEERHWRAIARDIVLQRKATPFKHAEQLSRVVAEVVGSRHLNKSLARVFQSLRIEVNSELDRIQHALTAAFQVLEEGGRLVVMSYHSLEDRIVKNFMKDKSRDCICPPGFPQCACDKVREMKVLTRKAVVASEDEVEENQRARSAKLRAAEKTVAYAA